MHATTTARFPTTRAVRNWTAAILATCAAVASLWVYAQSVSPPPFRTFSYRGYLERDGAAINGTVDLEFRLFDSEHDGTELPGSPIRVNGVAVAAGQLSAPIEVSDPAAMSGAIWLQVAIDSGDGLIMLGGRQRLLSVPFAAASEESQVAQSARAASGALRTELDGVLRQSGGTISGSLTVADGLRPNFVSRWYRVNADLNETTTITHGLGVVPSLAVIQWTVDTDPESPPPPSDWEPSWVKVNNPNSAGVPYGSPETFWLGANDAYFLVHDQDYVIYCDQNNPCPAGWTSTRQGLARLLLWR